MCLHVITEKYSIPLKEMIGYQVVIKTKNPGIFQSTCLNMQKKMGVRHKSKQNRIVILASDIYGNQCDMEYFTDIEYLTGFHFFTNKKDAFAYGCDISCKCVVKVKCENIRIKGVQNHRVIYIADYLTILEVV